MFSVSWCNIGSLFCSPRVELKHTEECVGLVQSTKPTSALNILQHRSPSLSTTFDNCLGIWGKRKTSQKPVKSHKHGLCKRVLVVRPGLVVVQNAPDVTIRAVECFNDHTLAFLPNRPLFSLRDEREIKFSSSSECPYSPLARRLLKIQGVHSIMLSSYHIRVEKEHSSNEAKWKEIKPLVLTILLDFFASNLPAITDQFLENPHNHTEQGECITPVHYDETSAIIDDLINTSIRPTVQDEGGDVIFKTFQAKRGTVNVVLLGTCLSSPPASKAICRLVLSFLQFHVPQVVRVLPVENSSLSKSWSSVF
ncbi:NFU1 iron-sulfur cluster scaffold homolog, mitochondrial-like isoform X2 [Clavelina lepadiformis]|uniref:NFU1 iron-sulfur cluster scaffold homolog, mitochondrial-like isoform X2 n=1 Tax=Clavelina lepadiformis TaxID=159417 RepID=UPI0040433475